jgi:hypothetical protein
MLDETVFNVTPSGVMTLSVFSPPFKMYRRRDRRCTGAEDVVPSGIHTEDGHRARRRPRENEPVGEPARELGGVRHDSPAFGRCVRDDLAAKPCEARGDRIVRFSEPRATRALLPQMAEVPPST